MRNGSDKIAEKIKANPKILPFERKCEDVL
jgi:hypothetical protein